MRGEGGFGVGERKGEEGDLGFNLDANVEARAERRRDLAAMAAMTAFCGGV